MSVEVEHQDTAELAPDKTRRSTSTSAHKSSGMVRRPSSSVPAEPTPAKGPDVSETHTKLGVKPTDLRMGRYELAFEVDTGGFATVFLARTVGPGGFQKVVALKRIHEHLAKNQEFVEMFLDEARIAAGMNHPNICPVFDFGEHEGVHYLTMDYLLGETLSAFAPKLYEASGKDSESLAKRCQVAAWIVASAADGLHSAHELRGQDGNPVQVVHRDVSPTNIFVRYDGHVQIVDFGLASAAEKIHSTKAGIAKGQVAYMSPEQLSDLKIDRRIDIWALGVVLWELLAGRRLFRRDTDAKTLHAILHEEQPRLSQVVPGIPARLESIVCCMLEKDRDARIQTAQEVSEMLRDYLHSVGSSVGAHDVARWMQEIFPGRLELKQNLIEQLQRRKTSVAISSAPYAMTNPPSAESVSPSVVTQVVHKGTPWWAWVLSTVLAAVVAAVVAMKFVAPQAEPVERVRTVVVEKEVPAEAQSEAKAKTEQKRTKDGRILFGPHGFIRVTTNNVDANIRYQGKTIGKAGENLMLPLGSQQIEIAPVDPKIKAKTLVVRVFQERGRRYRVNFEGQPTG